MQMIYHLFYLLFLPLSTSQYKVNADSAGLGSQSPYDALFAQKPRYLSDGFDFPVGKPDAKGYYNAQKFGKSNLPVSCPENYCYETRSC